MIEENLGLTTNGKIVLILPDVTVATMKLALHWSATGYVHLANQNTMSEVMSLLKRLGSSVEVSLLYNNSGKGKSQHDCFPESKVKASNQYSHIVQEGPGMTKYDKPGTNKQAAKRLVKDNPKPCVVLKKPIKPTKEANGSIACTYDADRRCLCPEESSKSMHRPPMSHRSAERRVGKRGCGRRVPLGACASV